MNIQLGYGQHRRTRSLLLALVAVVMIASGLATAPATAGTTEEAAALPNEVTYIGEASSATGAALGGGVCDVNGDGYADVVVGAWFWDKLPTNSNEGTTYVLFGGPDGEGADLADMTSAPGRFAQLDGATPGDTSGFAVGCAGDVNGDGYDDVLIGNYIRETVHVVFGSQDFGHMDLGYLGNQGFIIRGSLTLDQNVGYAVTGVGDLDGDGLDDIGVAAVVADTLGRNNNGRIYVVPGQRSTAAVDLTNNAASLLILEGSTAEERLGSLAAVGDVTGDGRPDIVVGSYTATPHGTAAPVAGSAWVISGRARGVIDLAQPLTNGFRIDGPIRGRDRLGISVAGVGDVNGDGINDVIIGGDGVTNAATGPRSGSAWVVFGSKSTDTVDAATLDETGRGYWIHGAAQNDSFGYSVDGIGDVNGDGLPDLIVGAYGYDPRNADGSATITNAGAAYVLYGKADSAPQYVAELTPGQGYRIDGTGPGDRFGRQVAAIGDYDGVGGADFVASGDFAVREGRTQGGIVRVFLPSGGGTRYLDAASPLILMPDVTTPTADGHVSVDLVCPAASAGCSGTVGLRGGAATQPFTLAAGETAGFNVALNAKGIRLLGSEGRVADQVIVKAQAPKGRTVTVDRRVTLLAEVKVPAAIQANPRFPISDSHAVDRWTPGSFDTCPTDLHDRFEVVASDGKRYPTWHPPTVVNPATGQPCTFGHEHGPDPRGSNIYDWVANQFANRNYSSAAGIPFGLAAEALDGYVAANPDAVARHEDHVGHKIDYVNNVELLDLAGNPIGVTCDYLFKLHQGTHSADALVNNVHELIYAMKCSDGAAVVSNTIVPFGEAGEYQSACAPATVRQTGIEPGYPGGTGGRLIPDRACIDSHILVPGTRGSSFWAIYENWKATNGLGDGLFDFSADFAVFDPSRYATGQSNNIARILDTCWEVDANGERANRRPCPDETDGDPFFCTWDNPQSPFKGAHREVFIGQATIRNAGGPTHIYTDPYGTTVSATPFPGSVRQYVAAVDTSNRPAVSTQLFGRNTNLGGDGVRAPN